MGAKQIISLVVIVVVLFILAWLLVQVPQLRGATVTNFEECAAAGYPIMESYPRQCRSADGQLFVEEIKEEPAAGPPKCVVAGCSSQLCMEESEAEVGGVTDCMYRAEYACYRGATCERQMNGHCEWTQTEELKACLKNPPAEEPMPQVI